MSDGVPGTELIQHKPSVPDSLYEYSVCCAVCVSFIISYAYFCDGPYGIAQYGSHVLWQL